MSERMTVAEYKAKKPGKSKYRNKPVVVDGVRIDSKREARRWGELQMLERAGDIRELERQVPIELAPPVRFEGEKREKPALRIVVDFRYVDCRLNRRIVEDVKSTPTAKKEAFRIKRHLLKSVHGIDVRIVR